MRSISTHVAFILPILNAVSAFDSIAMCFGSVTKDAVYSHLGQSSQYNEYLDDPIDLYMYVSEADGTPYDSVHLANVVGPVSNHHYDVFDEVLYIDASPGAYQPVGFKRKSDLKGGETSSFWVLPYGMLIWTPVDDVGVSLTPTNEFAAAFVHEPVEGVEGLSKVFWNQTLYVEKVAGRATNVFSNIFPFCYGDYDAITVEKGNAW